MQRFHLLLSIPGSSFRHVLRHLTLRFFDVLSNYLLEVTAVAYSAEPSRAVPFVQSALYLWLSFDTSGGLTSLPSGFFRPPFRNFFLRITSSTGSCYLLYYGDNFWSRRHPGSPDLFCWSNHSTWFAENQEFSEIFCKFILNCQDMCYTLRNTLQQFDLGF